MDSASLTLASTVRDTLEAEMASAFSHPLRLHLLRRLSMDRLCVNQLVEAAGVSQPMVSRHLASLRKLGIVSCRIEGRKRCYELCDPTFVGGVLAALALAQAPRSAQPSQGMGLSAAR